MRTVKHALKFALKGCKQKGAVAADKWGGANSDVLGAGDRVLLEELSIDDAPEFYKDQSINGTQLAQGQDIVSMKADVSGKMIARVRKLACFFSLLFGWEDLEGPLSVTGKYSHLISFCPAGKDQRDFTAAEIAKFEDYPVGGAFYNTHLTIGIEEGPSERIAKNVQLLEFTISGAQKEPIRIDFSGVGESVSDDAAKATSPSWSFPSGDMDSAFHTRHCTSCQIGPAGGTLQTVHLIDFSIKGKYGAVTDVHTTVSGLNREYPWSDGASELTFEATVFLHDSQTWASRLRAQDALSAKLQFTRGTDILCFYLPSFKLTDAKAEYDNAGTVKITGQLFNYTGTDPFSSDHGHVLDFPTPLYVRVVDGDTDNGLLKY